jgi:hypothetical protein
MSKKETDPEFYTDNDLKGGYLNLFNFMWRG